MNIKFRISSTVEFFFNLRNNEKVTTNARITYTYASHSSVNDTRQRYSKTSRAKTRFKTTKLFKVVACSGPVVKFRITY
jgi:hypothetical protein